MLNDIQFRERAGRNGSTRVRTISAHDDAGRKLGHVRLNSSGSEVQELHVSPKSRGQGIGGALMREAVGRYGRTQSMHLEASPFGAGQKLDSSRLMEFYRGHGFEADGDSNMMRRTPG